MIFCLLLEAPSQYYFLIMEIRWNVLTAISNLKTAPHKHNIFHGEINLQFTSEWSCSFPKTAMDNYLFNFNDK